MAIKIKRIALIIFSLLILEFGNQFFQVAAFANQSPVLDPIGDQSVNEGMLLQFIVNANDSDGDMLTYTAINLPDNATFNPTAKTFSWTPTYFQAGTYQVQFQASDGQFSASQTVIITVNKVNQPPLLNDPPSYSVTVGEALSFTINSGKPGYSDGVTYSAVNLPPGATFNSATKSFNWTPTVAGIYPVQFTANDGRNLLSIVMINVYNPDSPTAMSAITTYLAGKGKQLNFSINADDPDGDPLIYFAGNLPSGATFNPATKIFSWTPNHNQIGDHTIRFMVSDGILSDSRDVKVIVNNVNQPPVFDAISARNVNPDLQCHFTVNAIDPDGDSLSYTANNLPAGATFEPATKTFSWTPDDSQTGSYQVKFTVSDGVASNTMDVSVTVSGSEVYGDGIVIIKGNSKPNTDNNVNRQPIFNPLNAQSIDEEKLLQFSVNAIDPDGDSLTYTADSLPDGASFDSTIGTFSWTPELGQAGSYRVSFTVSDGKLVDSQDVVINVNIVDAEIGLNYFGARFYDAETARFLTADPKRQDLNWYSYCGNNPLKNVDPDGMAYDVFDVGFFAWSVNDFVNDPSLENFGWMALDGLSLLPVVPSTGYVRRGIQLANKADNLAKSTIKVSSRALGKNLEKAGIERGVNQAAHHIVAGNDKRGAFARSVLEEFGININDAINGVFLNSAEHSKVHTNKYYDAVDKKLAQAESKQDVIEALESIADELSAGTFPE